MKPPDPPAEEWATSDSGRPPSLDNPPFPTVPSPPPDSPPHDSPPPDPGEATPWPYGARPPYGQNGHGPALGRAGPVRYTWIVPVAPGTAFHRLARTPL